VPLPRGGVAYVLDCSQANGEVLDTAKAAAYRSARSLGAAREFQIVFWRRADEPVIAHPAEGLVSATEDEVDAAEKRFEDVVAYGTTELQPALALALESEPASIVIATAKGSSLGDDVAAAAKDLLKGSSVTVHTFSLGEAESDPLKQIAAQTGGTYHEMSDSQLRAFAQ
jgi:hypothetical protein